MFITEALFQTAMNFTAGGITEEALQALVASGGSTLPEAFVSSVATGTTETEVRLLAEALLVVDALDYSLLFAESLPAPLLLRLMAGGLAVGHHRVATMIQVEAEAQGDSSDELEGVLWVLTTLGEIYRHIYQTGMSPATVKDHSEWLLETYGALRQWPNVRGGSALGLLELILEDEAQGLLWTLEASEEDLLATWGESGVDAEDLPEEELAGEVTPPPADLLGSVSQPAPLPLHAPQADSPFPEGQRRFPSRFDQ